MRVSYECVELIKRCETCELSAYRCPAGIYTIGWGHTRGVKAGDTCTLKQADAWLAEDIEQAEAQVIELVKVPLTQGQFDALVSFAFNCGPDIDDDSIPEGLGDSTLLRKLNAGDYLGAANEFPRWTRARGVIMPGLVRRREKERTMFTRSM